MTDPALSSQFIDAVRKILAEQAGKITTRAVETSAPSDDRQRPAPHPPALSPVEQARFLTAAYENFIRQNDLHPGQIVRWKPLLRNRLRPFPGQPAIVVEQLAEPWFDTMDSTSEHAREPLDIRLGVVGEDGSLLVFLFDSRRFEPFPLTNETPQVAQPVQEGDRP